MDYKYETFRERITENTSHKYEKLRSRLENEEQIIFEMKLVDSSKGVIEVYGNGFCSSFCNRAYANTMKKQKDRLVAPLIAVESKNGYAYYTVLIPYPWLPNRNPLPTPTKDQVIPSLKIRNPKKDIFRAQLSGVNYHCSEEDYERVLAHANTGGKALLRREYDNKYDKNAVSVHLPDGKCIGYLSRDDARNMHIYVERVEEMKVDFASVNPIVTDIFLEWEQIFEECLSLTELFSKHTVTEIYKAALANRIWTHYWEDLDNKLFHPKRMEIDFDYILKQNIYEQDKIAEHLAYNLTHAQISNPTNPGLLMSVPLNLEDYETNWKEIDLTNNAMMELIAIGNKLCAIFLRIRRTDNPFMSVEEFCKYCGGLNDKAVIKRLKRIVGNSPY